MIDGPKNAEGTARSYPERNPFPYQGSIVVDTAQNVRTPGAASPTLLWPPVNDLKALVERYLEGYRPSVRGVGFPVALRGAHGAGKTHTVRHVIESVATGDITPPIGTLATFQVYARAETQDFLELYRQLMRQVPGTLLRDMTLRFLGIVSSELFGDTLRSDEARSRAAKVVIDNPETIRSAFERHLVDEDQARATQADEVKETVGKEENFHNVLGYLLRDDLGETARAWLAGERVSTENARKLGVGGPIETPQIARWGLRFLATLFGRGGRPLIVYIDQYEKLVFNADQSLHSTNVGLLRSLIDELAKESAMLVLGGNEEAWDALAAAPDLRQRFGKNVISFPLLTVVQAQRLVSLYVSLGRYEIVESWSMELPSETHFALRGHAQPIRSLVVSPDRRLAVSGSRDGSVKVWDLQSRRLRTTLLPGDAVNGISMSPDGTRLAAACDDRVVWVWDVDTGRELSQLHGHESWVNSVAFSPDGQLIASGASDTTVRIWDARHFRSISVLAGHTDTVWSVAFHPNGSEIASSSSDGTIHLWSVSAARSIAHLRGHASWVNTVAYAPDGEILASASDDHSVRLWDRNRDWSSTRLAGHQDSVRAVAWLGDDRLLSASIDDVYILWDRSGVEIQRVHRPAGNIVAFAPLSDGRAGVSILSGVSDMRRRAHSDASREVSIDELYPFDDDAVRVVLSAGGGNLRRLVQNCAEVFERALPTRTPITGALALSILEGRHDAPADRDAVLKQIERLLTDRTIDFVRQYRVGEATADIGVIGPSGVPRMLIEVVDPIFYVDEAERALANVRLAESGHKLALRVVLVVVGYVSPEVTALLERAVHDLIVFDAQQFEMKLAPLLDNLKAQLGGASLPSADLDALKADIDDVKRAVQQIALVREREAANIDHGIRGVLQTPSAERAEQQREETKRAWLEERKNLEDRIREVRQRRAEAELVELEALRDKAESAFRGRLGFATVVILLCGLIGASVAIDAAAAPSLGRSSYSGLLYWTGMGVVCGCYVGISVLLVSQSGGPRLWMWDLAGRVTSLDQLDRLAVDAGRRAWMKLRLLRHPNPHFRYAGSLLAGAAQEWPVLLRALRAEPSATLRRIIAKQLGGADGMFLDVLFKEVVGRRTVEVGYALEEASRLNRIRREHMLMMSGNMRALALVAGGGWMRPGSLPYEELLPYGRVLGLAIEMRFGGGVEQLVGEEGDHVLREALRDLSPFDKPGVGTLDHLECIDQIDAAFIVFSQIRFLGERA
jgi:WD40 repeat protein